jgi:6-phospho-beta-glucosidase
VVKALEEELFKRYSDPQLDIKPLELEQRGGAYYSDAACNLMASIYTDKGDIQPVNTINNGAIADLPNDVVVEVSSVITKEGPRPLAMGSLPEACRGLVQQLKANELLACKAAVSGSYEEALAAMVTNPLVQSEKLGAAVLDELLLAHSQYLPQFKKAIEAVRKRHALNS